MKNIALNYHINSTRGKLSAMEMMFEYIVANLCIKSNPMLLLPITIPIGGAQQKLEECAMVGIADDKHIEVYPLNNTMIPQITKGIILQHPDLDVNLKEKEQDDDPDILVLTMPEMTKTRRDTLKEIIKVKYEQIKGQMEEEFAKATAELSSLTSKVKPEEIDECKSELEKAHDEVFGQMKQSHDEILEYVESEYEAHSVGSVEQQKKEEEQKAATDESVAKKIKL